MCWFSHCRVDLFAVGAAGSNLESADVLRCYVHSTRHRRCAGPRVISDRDVDAVLPHMRVGGGDGLPADGVLDDDETFGNA